MGKSSQRKWCLCWASKDEQEVHRQRRGRAAASWVGTAWTEEERGQNGVRGLVAWGSGFRVGKVDVARVKAKAA